MDHQHSTPELVKHHDIVRAPERGRDATAFELDASAPAPEVVIDTAPEVFYNNSPPEVHKIDKSTKERAPSPHVSKAAFRWYGLITMVLVTVAIAVGVGVGISISGLASR